MGQPGDDGEVVAQVAERFRFVGIGVTLQLADPEALAPHLPDQLVVVQEDAAGVVLGATTTQIAGLLDDRFATAGAVTDLGVTFVRSPIFTAYRARS